MSFLLSVPAEIHHQLFGLLGVKLEVVLLAPVYIVCTSLHVNAKILRT